MKKIISIILATAVSLQLAVLPVMAKVSSTGEHGWKVVTGMGLADFKDSQKDEKITRLEYAEFLVSALGIVVKDSDKRSPALFEKAFYSGIGNTAYSNSETVQTPVYNDIDVNNDVYKGLLALYNLGIMKGDSEGYFHPERFIKYEEVLKTFVVLASYNVDANIPGSWPMGYVNLASEIDITIKGVSVGEEITKYQLCQIFYNMFDVEMMRVMGITDNKVSYIAEEGITFLNEVLGLYAFKGQLESTIDSTITMPYTERENTIKINGISYLNKTISPMGQLLGREVEAYRTEDGDVVFMTTIDDEEVTVIDVTNNPTYADGVLSYEINNKMKNIDITGLPVIYNGAALPTYTPSEIFNLHNGKVYVTEKAKQNVVIVWDPKDMLVGSVSAEHGIIFEENTGYELNVSEDKNVYIYAEDGSPAKLSDISKGSIISYIENDPYREIHINGKTETGVCKKIDINNKTITVEGKTYHYTRAMEDNNELVKLTLNTNVTAYINSYGRIFHVEVGKMIGEGAGILVKAFENDDGGVSIKLFDNAGEFVVYPCREKVNFIDSHNDTFKIGGEILIDNLNAYRATGASYFVYKLNANGEITYIQIPLENESYLRHGEEKIYGRAFNVSKNSSFRTNEYRLGSSIFLNAESKIFLLPSDLSKTDEYERTTVKNLKNYQYCSGYVYFKSDKGPLAEAIIMNDLQAIAPSFDSPLVVTSVEETLGEDDEIIKSIHYVNYVSNKSGKLYSKYDSSGKTEFDDMMNVVSTSTDTDIDVGDIIFATVKPGTEEVEDVYILFDCDIDSPAGSEGKKGWIPAIGTPSVWPGGGYTNKYVILKNRYDAWKADPVYRNQDFFTYIDSQSDGKITDIPAQNPFLIGSGNAVAEFHKTWTSGQGIMLGYVYDFKDGIVTLTTQDLSCETYDKDEMIPINDQYVAINFERYFNLVASNTYIGVIEYYPKEVVVRDSTDADIYTYINSGRKCSRMLKFNDGRWFIINDYR